MSEPRLSFVVLSYNYAEFIGKTIHSILAQTVQDFEIVVIDDASRDKSRELIQSFGDQRIRLFTNDRNMGGAWSYNRAVSASRGEWLVNLDADDWIEPQKSEKQLRLAEANPKLDIIGTYVTYVDSTGSVHPEAEKYEAETNQARDLNSVDSWIGANRLCRSSTMVRREAHLRIGLDDPHMVRAPDYELWTRALREGCRFAVLPEKLTFYRLRRGGVTHGDPAESLFEMSYAMLRNLLPLAEARALWPSCNRIAGSIVESPSLPFIRPIEAYRLFAMVMAGQPADNYASFRAAILNDSGDAERVQTGRRWFDLARAAAAGEVVDKLYSDIDAYISARDAWRARYEALDIAVRRQTKLVGADRDAWRARYEALDIAVRRTFRWRMMKLAQRAYSRFSRSS